jgi:hypothetical protein
LSRGISAGEYLPSGSIPLLTICLLFVGFQPVGRDPVVLLAFVSRGVLVRTFLFTRNSTTSVSLPSIDLRVVFLLEGGSLSGPFCDHAGSTTVEPASGSHADVEGRDTPAFQRGRLPWRGSGMLLAVQQFIFVNPVLFVFGRQGLDDLTINLNGPRAEIEAHLMPTIQTYLLILTRSK